jgi:hypothetical protein
VKYVGCSIVYFGRRVATFAGTCCVHLHVFRRMQQVSPRWWYTSTELHTNITQKIISGLMGRQQVLLKRWHQSTKLHGVTSHRTVIVVVSASILKTIVSIFVPCGFTFLTWSYWRHKSVTDSCSTIHTLVNPERLWRRPTTLGIDWVLGFVPRLMFLKNATFRKQDLFPSSGEQDGRRYL